MCLQYAGIGKSQKNRADLAGLSRYGDMPTETALVSKRHALQDTPLRGMPQISLLIPLVALLHDKTKKVSLTKLPCYCLGLGN